LAVLGQTLDQLPALGLVAQRARAQNREPRADRKQHVRVIDRVTVAVRRSEHVRLVAEHAAELLERRVARARRSAGVRDAADSIEHEAPGALEIWAAMRERREIDHARDSITVLVTQRVDDVVPAFAAPIRREQ